MMATEKKKNNPTPADVALYRLAAELATDWREHRARRVAGVDPTLRAAHQGTDRDGAAVRDLLLEIGRALMGDSWSGVRRAHAALREEDRGSQERLRRALGTCHWALWAWKTGLGRRTNERAQAYQARLDDHREAQLRIAEMLLRGIQDQDPTFNTKVLHVQKTLSDYAKRGNASPATLLRKLGAFQDVSNNWMNKTLGELRQKTTK